MDFQIKKIIIPQKTRNRNSYSKSTKIQNLENYVEISPEYLQYLHNSWVKYTSKQDGSYDPGGFIVDVTRYRLNLRTPQKQELTEVVIASSTFYINKDDKNYQSLKELMIEKKNVSERLKLLVRREKELNEQIQVLAKNEKNLEERTLEFEKLRAELLLRNKNYT